MTLLGPADAPWRTRAAVPKALRDTVAVVPDDGPGVARAGARGGAHRPARRRPRTPPAPCCARRMAAGCAVLAPRCAGGRRGRRPRRATPSCCRPSPARPGAAPWPSWWPIPRGGRRLGAAARGARGHAHLGRRGRASSRRPTATPSAVVRPRPAARGACSPTCACARGRGSPPAQIVAACARARHRRRWPSPGPVDLSAARAAAPPRARRPDGHRRRRRSRPPTARSSACSCPRRWPTGLSPAEAAAAIHAQGGLVMAPHTRAPVARRAARPGGRGRPARVAAAAATGRRGEVRLLRRLGLLAGAGSGATRPEEVGAHLTDLRALRRTPRGCSRPLADAASGRVARRRAAATRGRGRGRGRRPRSPETAPGRSNDEPWEISSSHMTPDPPTPRPPAPARTRRPATSPLAGGAPRTSRTPTSVARSPRSPR